MTASNNPIRVIIADDHPLLRSGLRETLEQDDVIDVIHEAGDGVEALATIRRHRPDIAILDIEMPGMNGLDIVRTLRGEAHPTRIIILTIHRSKRLFDKMQELGVDGYILKESSVGDILDGILSVYHGEQFISPVLAAGMFRDPSPIPIDGCPDLGVLSRAERRVLRLVAENRTSREIADILCISQHTVTRHREHIAGKLDLHGNFALMRFCLEHNAYIMDALGKTTLN